MADKKSRLAEIYKSEKTTGGGLTSTLGKRFKEKFDPRQMFNQQGFMAALLPSIFKAYKAPTLSSKLSPALSPTASSGVSGLSNEKLDILIAQSKDIKINSTIVAKNSMSNNAMARDMNLMRQNIFQLVKLNKGEPTNKADMFFKHAGKRDKEYKSKFKKESKVANNTAPTKTGDTGKSEGLLGVGGALGGALGGLSKGIGIASKLGGLGLGLAAFLTALGGAAWAIDKLGGMSGLKDVLTNLAEGLGAFSGGSLVALGALFAGSMLFGGGTKGLNIAVVGVGIAGFLTALGAAGALVDAMGGSGGIKTLLTDLAEGLGAFSGGSLVALGSLFAAGAIFGATGLAGKTALGIGAMGVGIGAFLLALGGAAAIIDLFGGGPKLKDLLLNVAEGLGAFSNGSLIALGSLFAAGAIFGSTGLAGPSALGIGAMGVGIGAFLLALGGAAAVIDLFGGGPKLKDLLINLAEGLGGFSGLDGMHLGKLALAIPTFGAAMLAFFSSAGIGGIVNSLAGGMKGLIDFIFGNEKKSPMQKLSEDLQLFQNINGDNLSKIGQGMKDLASGMLGLAKLTDEDLAKVSKASVLAKTMGGTGGVPPSSVTPAPTGTTTQAASDARASAAATDPRRTDIPQTSPTPSKGGSSTTPSGGGKNPLLDMIAQGESSGAGGYNAMNQGTPGGGPVIGSGDSQKIIQKKLTDMTVGEIMDKGAKPNDDAAKRKENGLIFAAGRYQIIPKTLEGLVKQGVVSKEDKFNEETQDKLGMALINGTGATKLAEGGNYEEAQNALAKVFASVPLATDIGNKKAGQSFYQAPGQNHGNSKLDVRGALMASVSTSSPNQSAATLVPNAPSSATTLAAATTAVSQEKMTLASAAPVVNNITNNNVNNSTSGGGSGSSAPSTASVYDDLFAKLVERALA